MHAKKPTLKTHMKRLLTITILILLPVRWAASQQAQIESGTNRGVTAVRLALPLFSSTSGGDQSAKLTQIFNDVLWNDLDNTGPITLVSRSFYPVGNFVNPGDIHVQDWRAPQVNAEFIAFGSAALNGGKLSIDVRLWDLKLTQNQELFGNRYASGDDSEAAVRLTAHKVADDILEKLGFGKGIAETKITFVSDRGDGANKEVWVMDYDGNNAFPLTSLKSITLTPSWSRDGQKIAFTTYRNGQWEIGVVSTLDRHRYPFPTFPGLTTTPSWSPDGNRLAFASSRDNNDGPEIYVADWDGSHLHRLTISRGSDVSPTWNPKTGQEIAFVSDRTGTAQIWRMDAEGTNVQRITDEGGAAVDPAWSPDGQFIAFAWQPKGPGTRYNIYLYEVASGKRTQLTGRTDSGGDNWRPAWAPDGKHIAFESTRTGTSQIYSMLADGTKVKQLTQTGKHNQGPNWSGYIQ
jgi:TolB protein